MWEEHHNTHFNCTEQSERNSERSHKSPRATILLNQVKEIGKLKIKSPESKLKDFNKITDEGEQFLTKEQGIIILQNIRISKKKFNFDIFRNKETEQQETKTLPFTSNDNKETNPKNEKNDLEEIGMKVINEKLFKENNIKIKLTGLNKLDILKNPDRYREIIKARIKNENAQRYE